MSVKKPRLWITRVGDFFVIVRRQTLISAKAVLAGSISATTRCYETKKRAHETLFGGEACSSAHCTLRLLCNLNAFASATRTHAAPLRNTMGARASELFSLAMQFVASLAWAVAALLEGLSSHIDALYFIAAVAWLLSCVAAAHAMGLLASSKQAAPAPPANEELKDNRV